MVASKLVRPEATIFRSYIPAHWWCRARVCASPRDRRAQTELGRIGKALQTIETEATPLQKEMGRLVRNLAIFGLSLCVLVTVVFGLTRANWLHAILAGITLAMAIPPNEFPVVLAIFMAPWCLAHITTTGADAAHTRDRDAWVGYGLMRGQDRDADDRIR